LKKGKGKGIPSQVGRGDFRPSQAQRTRARGRRPSCGPRRGRRRGRGSDGITAGPTRQRERRGERRHGSTARANRPAAGKKPGRRWARRRFAAGDPVLRPRGGALARGGAGEPRGRLDLARGGREGGCPRGGGGAPRRGSPSVSFGRGIGAGEWCSGFAAM
jgi:hypothetical protein